MKKLSEIKDALMICGQKLLKIIIPEPPVPQARVKFGKGGHAYEPAKCTNAKKNIRDLAAEAMKKQNFSVAHKDMPISVTFWFYKPIPASKQRWWKLAAKFGLIAPTSKKGDIDNLVKLALDGINGVAMYDDCQVIEIHAYSRYSDNPRTEIEVKALYVNVGDVKNRVKVIELEGEK